MFWTYAHKNPLDIQQYLGSLINRRGELTDSLPRNVLFYQQSEEVTAFSLAYFGYFKELYRDQRDLEEKLLSLKPNETPYILKYLNGQWMLEKVNKPQKKVSKVNIPIPRVSKVLMKSKFRPWILPNGEFIEDTDDEGRRKQVLLVKMFNIDVFSKYNDFRFYYLSNLSNSPIQGRDIQLRTGAQIYSEASSNPQTMFLIFL